MSSKDWDGSSRIRSVVVDARYISSYPHLPRNRSASESFKSNMGRLELKRFTTPETHHTYAYDFHAPSTTGTPTLLFLHGFPTVRTIWRDQIAYFSSLGYGIIAPDLLGFGASDAPDDTGEYLGPIQAADLAALLSSELFGEFSPMLHGIGHDAGAYILSRLYNYYPGLFRSTTFISVPYSPPGLHFDLDSMGRMSAKMVGVDKFGYIRFLASDEAPAIIAQNVHGFIKIAFNNDPRERAEWFYPPGQLERYLKEGKFLGAVVLDQEAEKRWKEAFGGIGEKGWRAVLAGYRVMVENLNENIEKLDLKENRARMKLEVPVLAIDSTPDRISVPGLMEKSIEAYLGQTGTLMTKTVQSQGHYPHLVSKHEVMQAIEDFVKGVDT